MPTYTSPSMNQKIQYSNKHTYPMILSRTDIIVIACSVRYIVDPQYRGYDSKGVIPGIYDRKDFIDFLFSFKNLVVWYVLKRNDFSINSIPTEYLCWETFKDRYPATNEDSLLYEVVDKVSNWIQKFEPALYNNTNDFKSYSEPKWHDL